MHYCISVFCTLQNQLTISQVLTQQCQTICNSFTRRSNNQKPPLIPFKVTSKINLFKSWKDSLIIELVLINFNIFKIQTYCLFTSETYVIIDQLSKQRKALQLEEDICLDLLSYCTSVSSPDIENYDRSETSRSLNSSESKPKIAKRRHRRKNLQTRVATTNLSVSTVSKPHLTEITSEVDEGTGFCSDSGNHTCSFIQLY